MAPNSSRVRNCLRRSRFQSSRERYTRCIGVAIATDALLEIKGLTVAYGTNTELVTALDSVDLELEKGEFLAIVGESGCGKSTLGLSIIGLLPRSSKIVEGSINYNGKNLAALDPDTMRSYRGTEIAMIFQEPLTSLDPVYRIGDQMAEAIAIRRERKQRRGDVSNREVQRLADTPSPASPARSNITSEVKDEMMKWLSIVRIADSDQVIDRYPFELSGGMTQRVMIAMALSQEPALLIADEPTTALDVTTQAQVLRLIRELIDNIQTSILLITHDLAVASQVADRVIVMYAGEIVEDAEVHQLFSNPLHPYTKGLISCIPEGTKDNSTLNPIPGSIPDPTQNLSGCKFASRCSYVSDYCRANRPKLVQVGENREVSCFLYGK